MFSLLTNQTDLGDPRRKWATLASFTVQAMAVSFLLMLPMMRPGNLPRLVLIGPTFAPPSPPPARAPDTTHRQTGSHTSEIIGITVLMPPRIPSGIPNIHDQDEGPPSAFGDPNGVPHGIGSSSNNTALQSVLDVHPIIPAHVEQPRVRPSRIMEGNLIRRVQPEYPPIARSAGIQGAVVLQAVISKQGTIENLRAISGHPFLVKAAAAAVMQWRYRPYYLNGEPIEVETRITVNFTLSRG